MRTVQELELELAAAKRREEEGRRAKAAATKRIREFRLDLITDGLYLGIYDKILDPSCVMYRLSCHIVNEAECKAVGKSVEKGGGANYLFNTLSGKIVMMVGGGNIYVGGGWNDEETADATLAFERLSAFLRERSEGGDVTHIIMAQKIARKWE